MGVNRVYVDEIRRRVAEEKEIEILQEKGVQTELYHKFLPVFLKRKCNCCWPGYEVLRSETK
jgi:hypothetical protein